MAKIDGLVKSFRRAFKSLLYQNLVGVGELKYRRRQKISFEDVPIIYGRDECNSLKRVQSESSFPGQKGAGVRKLMAKREFEQFEAL
jgi:hypothetical protein